MQSEKKQRLLELCSQAISEQDPKKLEVLLREINDLLEEKRRLVITQQRESKS